MVQNLACCSQKQAAVDLRLAQATALPGPLLPYWVARPQVPERVEAAAVMPLRACLFQELQCCLFHALKKSALEFGMEAEGEDNYTLSLVVSQLHRVADLTPEQLQALADLFDKMSNRSTLQLCWRGHTLTLGA